MFPIIFLILISPKKFIWAQGLRKRKLLENAEIITVSSVKNANLSCPTTIFRSFELTITLTNGV